MFLDRSVVTVLVTLVEDDKENNKILMKVFINIKNQIAEVPKVRHN